MTGTDIDFRDLVDVEEALSQFKRDLVAVDEAVWSGLTKRLPERRGVMGRRKGAGTSRADLVTREAPVKIQLTATPMVGASGSTWATIGQHSAVVDLLPVMGTSASAIYLAGSATVAAVGTTFQHRWEKKAVQRLQETARAGVELTLELSQLEAALKDSLANYSSSVVIRPVLAKSVDRVNDALEGYLLALDKTHSLGDLTVHFPWAVEPELDPTRIRQTLTVGAESLRASVLAFADDPETRTSVRAGAPSAEPQSAVAVTAGDLAQRIGTLSDTMSEVSRLAEGHDADDLRDSFARAWADGMFAYDRFRAVAQSGDIAAAGETFETTARRFAGHVETACSTPTGRNAKFIDDDLRTRMSDAAELARQIVLSAQYLDAIAHAPAVSTTPSAPSDVGSDDTTIGDVKAAADGMTTAFERAGAYVSMARYHTEFGLPGLRGTLHECEIVIERGRGHLADVLLQANLIAVSPDVPAAVSRLERTTIAVDGVVSASHLCDQLTAQAAHGARLISESPGAHVDHRLVDALYWAGVSPLTPQATTLRKEWTGLTAALDRISRS